VCPKKIGRELNVRGVVTGRVSRRGDTFVVGAELIDVSRESQLWGEQYSEKLAAVLGLQEEISKAIADNLRIQLSGKEQQQLAKRDTENGEAYQLYLRGRYYWNKRTNEGVKKGWSIFSKRSIRIGIRIGLCRCSGFLCCGRWNVPWHDITRVTSKAKQPP